MSKVCHFCGYDIEPLFHGKPVTFQNRGRATVYKHEDCQARIDRMLASLIAGVKK